MAQNILLEAGTNEMELLIFRLDTTPFGINVAKVREIIQRQPIVAVPHSPDTVEGSFTLREKVLTLVNIGRYFGMEGEATRNGEGLIVVVEFNNIQCGVLVDTVEVIHRLNWKNIEPPSSFLSDLEAPITGTTEVDGQTVLIADFETIIGEILGVGLQKTDAEKEGAEKRAAREVRVLFADDSAMLRSAVKKVLNSNGYEDLTICSDGQEAWECMEAAQKGERPMFDIVLSDIEMPRVDGLHLTSRIKRNPDLRDVPVILFSSLINEDNRKKGEMVGADAQISKPDSKELVEAIQNCLMARGVNVE